MSRCLDRHDDGERENVSRIYEREHLLLGLGRGVWPLWASSCLHTGERSTAIAALSGKLLLPAFC